MVWRCERTVGRRRTLRLAADLVDQEIREAERSESLLLTHFATNAWGVRSIISKICYLTRRESRSLDKEPRPYVIHRAAERMSLGKEVSRKPNTKSDTKAPS